MKTLINKVNPAIRITAPEIRDGKYTYMVDYISEHDSENEHHTFYLWKESWTLVEEEENISWADRLKERLSKMSQEEIDKAFEEMGGDNDESPTLEEYLKAAYHSPIETEPVDLEKEVSKWWDASFPEPDFKFRKHRAHIVSNDEIIHLARHFYELGLKARKEE